MYKKPKWIFFLSLVLLVSFTIGLTTISGEIKPVLQNTTENQVSQSTPQQATIVRIAIDTVNRSFAEFYSPPETNINSGDTVVWTNIDTKVHTVTSGNPTNGPSGLFNSSLLFPGQTFTYTFENAGEFGYFCMLHPVIGKVIVL